MAIRIQTRHTARLKEVMLCGKAEGTYYLIEAVPEDTDTLKGFI